ncbi:hypothetical protein OIE68_40065 [Nocardia vinacea]|uniref:hypothetical protein n=1 Tax=Nocardia vinacea TaxID=96468 RepID=UPI002E0D8669|nr:hypothetical protein OIE68_40065 [Nocardia vinacea]
MVDSDRREVTVVAAPVELAGIRDFAANNGIVIEEMDHEGFADPISVMLILSGSAFALASFADYRERQRGGQVFDLREGSRFAYRTPDIAYGLIAVRGYDGSVTIEVKQPKSMLAEVTSAVMNTISELGDKTVEHIAKALEVVVGDRSEITEKKLDDPDT